MTFSSILFDSSDSTTPEYNSEIPAFFVDLNLDQIIDAITAGRQVYNLKPFYYNPLSSEELILYRQAIMQDVEQETLAEEIRLFANKMQGVHRHLSHAKSIKFKYCQEAWLLEAALLYCQAVKGLVAALTRMDLQSSGLSSFRDYLQHYTARDYFQALNSETESLKTTLSGIKYCVAIKNKTVKVHKYDSEIDYGAEVENTFAGFRQDVTEDYRVNFGGLEGMDYVEAQILDRVARLYPGVFKSLDHYYRQHASFLDETICVFDREIQFYLAYLEFIAPLKRAGLDFCYPQTSGSNKAIYNYEGFDLALANKLVKEHSPVVSNDFFLREKERIIIVTGPNQGGKTTFARTFGQLHYLASLGCPVPGREARLFLYDHIFTHFERAEDITDLRGKLEDDLLKIHSILNQATGSSIILINEMFTSTTLQDATFLSKKVLDRMFELDLLCVYVTFIEELAALDVKTVSMVSTVVAENPEIRTFKIMRKPADGLAYAASIAEKYRLTYKALRERITE